MFTKKQGFVTACALVATSAFTITAFNTVNKLNKKNLANNNIIIVDEDIPLNESILENPNDDNYLKASDDIPFINDIEAPVSTLIVSSYSDISETNTVNYLLADEPTDSEKAEESDKPKKKLTKLEKYKEKLKDKGIVDLSESDEDALTIHKKASKKSKVKGYLPDGGILTVGEKSGKWIEVESGSIKGYVQKKYVLTGDDVEELLLYNEDVTALMKKDSVYILGKAEKDSTAVGIGYIDNEYPIVAFSDNGKYAMIERTANISGWVPLSAIKININAPEAMNKDDYEDYEIELEYEEQQALDAYLSLAIGSTGDSLTDGIIALISHNESGNYKAARNPKTSGEKTITVGAWQWYGENAHGILKQICNADNDTALEIIESAYTGRRAKKKAKALYDEITGGDNWEKNKRLFDNKELIAIQELLGSDQGVNIQNSRIQSDIQAKITVAISTYNLSNDAIVTYFCDLFWQNPSKAKAIINDCIDHFGSARKFCKADNGLKYLHKQALESSTFGKYAKRRKYTYAYCKALD